MPYAIAASAVIGAGTSIFGASKAAGAAKDAAALQEKQYQTTRGDLQPYNQAGQSVLGDLSGLARSGPYGGGTNYLDAAYANQPGQMTQAQLEQTPGYQFALSQGLQTTQNAAAARGLGVSGASLKGAAKFATGLADSTYQNQFANAQTRFQNLINLNTGQQSNLQNQYNRLSGVATLGQNAAAQTGKIGGDAAATEGKYLNSAGQLMGAGIQGAGNALTGGTQSYLGYNALQDYLAKGNPAPTGNGTTGGYATPGSILGAPATINNAPWTATPG
jgi:hypothetical protein